MIFYVIKQIKFNAKIGTPISKQKIGNFILIRFLKKKNFKLVGVAKVRKHCRSHQNNLNLIYIVISFRSRVTF